MHAFKNEYRDSMRGTNYNLLLVPKGVEMSDFDSIRQAENAGVKVVIGHAGPP